MPFKYASTFRRDVCVRLLAGEPVAPLASELHVSAGTLHRWKKQALIDHDLVPGGALLPAFPRVVRETESPLLVPGVVSRAS
jgi:transposase-like protein